MDNRLFNLLRYCLSFIILFLSAFNALSSVLCAVALLFVNNFLDDVVFYKGNLHIRKDIDCNGIISPVNGVVTKVEDNVQLFSGIKKVDPLTHEEIMSIAASNDDKNSYNHITVFLNKLNHHVVINPSSCRSVSFRNSSTGNIEMVSDGELIGDNESYLCNDAMFLKYDTFYVVVTFDKYVSDYILGTYVELSPRLLICKGSQCDIYVDSNRDVVVKEGDIVNIGDCIVRPKYILADGVKMTGIGIDYGYIQELVSSALKKHGGIIGLLLSNMKKTLDTFKNPLILVCCVVGVILYTSLPLLSYVAFSSILSFVIVRWYRNLMYSMMNYVGLKHWMETSYFAISKLSILWRTKKKK